LAARWWQWDFSQPAASNPLSDRDGTFCAQGQKGPVWFLAGIQGGGTVTKTCTIPAEKDLFFNIVGRAYIAFPTDPPAEQTVAYVKSQVALANVSNATDLSASVDNKPLPARSVRFEDSAIFSVTVPDGNIFGQSAGTVDYPGAQAGYYAYVQALHPGKHTLHFTGKLPGRTLLDVTYQLTVTKD
jgi:hypothetical protein